MKRTVQSLLAILVILGVGVPLWTFVIAVAPEPPQAPPRDLGPVPVAVEPVAARDIQLEVEVYGTLLPLRRMGIACELGGRIETLYPDWRPGARVVAGTELIALEQEPFLIGLEQAEARLAEAGAGSRVAEIRLAAARREHEKRGERRLIAVREEGRMVELEEGGIASKSQIDRVRDARLQAESALDRAAEALVLAEAEEPAANARVKQAEAACSEAQDKLDRSRVVAPFTGRLSGRAPSVGAVVSPGAHFGELLDVSRLVLSAAVSEGDIARIGIGCPAEVRLASSPELVEPEPLAGVVTALAPETDPATRSGRVEVELDNTERGLVAGLFARATIRVGSIEDAVVVQRRHFLWRDGEPLAYVLVFAGTDGEPPVAEARRLVLATPVDEGFIVAGGLAVGETLITWPLDRLWDGAPCSIPGSADETAEPQPVDATVGSGE